MTSLLWNAYQMILFVHDFFENVFSILMLIYRRKIKNFSILEKLQNLTKQQYSS